jgi:adenylate cyclase class 2
VHLIEVERKRRLPDAGAELTRQLERHGYRHSVSVSEVDIYYSRPDVDFMRTVECLRVRCRGDFAEITYKPASNADTHSADGVIAKRETNVVLRDGGQAGTADQLLDAIGMVNLARVEKTRTRYRHPDRDDIVVSIDNVIGAGIFVETEVMAARPDVATGLLAEIENLLGIADHPIVSQPYRDLVMQAARR